MIIIKVTDRFEKKLAKLSKKIYEKVYLKLALFENNPFDITLKNHPLKGIMEGKRSISVTGDVRIIFMEKNDYEIVYLLDIGTHSQLY